MTCMTCGSQYDVEYDTSTLPVNCECGPMMTFPEVHAAGVFPSERAAEKLRYRAFHSAGLVKNIGAVALTISIISVVFFPMAIVGIGIGVYAVATMRGPRLRYAGRSQAIGAIVLGTFALGVGGGVSMHLLKRRRMKSVAAMQQSVGDDLRRLLRTQRLYRAAQDRYGRFSDFPGRFRAGRYTLYLGPRDFIPAERNGLEIKDELPDTDEFRSWCPSSSPDAFTAIAVANLDGDSDLDVWLLNDSGQQYHLANDNDYLKDFAAHRPPAATRSSLGEAPDDTAPDSEEGAQKTSSLEPPESAQ